VVVSILNSLARRAPGDALLGLVRQLQAVEEAAIGAHPGERPVRAVHQLLSRVAHVADHVAHPLQHVALELVVKLPERQAGDVRVDVVVLVQHLGRVLEPRVAEVADHEAHVRVVDRDVVDQQRVRLAHLGMLRVGVAAVDHHRDVVFLGDAEHALQRGIVDRIAIVAGIELDALDQSLADPSPGCRGRCARRGRASAAPRRC
jgi:hypothetical protein